jgi:hypothetical protein
MGPNVELSIGGNVYSTGANSGVSISEGKGLKVKELSIGGGVYSTGGNSPVTIQEGP